MSEKNNTRISYIVPSLRGGGPTNQLFMIAKVAQKHFDVEIVALHGEPSSISQRSRFEKGGFRVINLEVNKIKSLVSLRSYLMHRRPALVHSQGFLPDILMSVLKSKYKWVATIRNFPFADYPSKFGWLIGYPMALAHLLAFHLCANAVACSAYIGAEMASKGVRARVIRNGVSPRSSSISKTSIALPDGPFMVSVGSLNKRKNNRKIAAGFVLINQKSPKAHMVFLGDGPEADQLKQALGDAGIFAGHVDNVYDWLDAASVFVSMSFSEGMPNSVLEALSAGKLCLLSDIEPHRELHQLFPDRITLVSLDTDDDALAEIMTELVYNKNNKDMVIDSDILSGEKMGQTYLAFYREVLEHESR